MRVKIFNTNWAESQKQLCDVRFRVFVDEQHVPESMEIDEYDNDAEHFLAIDEKTNMPVATARLLKTGQVGRMAVLADYRCKNIGRLLLNSIDVRALELHLPELFLHAQIQARGFYEKAGFTAVGEVFPDAGIEHIKMIKKPG